MRLVVIDGIDLAIVAGSVDSSTYSCGPASACRRAMVRMEWEKVLALTTREAALFAGVMDDGNAFGSVLDADDILELVS